MQLSYCTLEEAWGPEPPRKTPPSKYDAVVSREPDPIDPPSTAVLILWGAVGVVAILDFFKGFLA